MRQQLRYIHTGFTLIELLVVVAIISILAAVLFPVLAKAKTAAKKSVSISNVRQLCLATLMYASDHDDHLPRTMKPDPLDPLAPPVTIGWWEIGNYQLALESYIKNGRGGVDQEGRTSKASIWFDPADEDRTEPIMWGSYSDNGHITGVPRNLSQIAQPSSTIYHTLRKENWAQASGVPIPGNWSTLAQEDPFWSSAYFDMCVDPWSTSNDPTDPFHWSHAVVPPPTSLSPGHLNARAWDLIEKERYEGVVVFSFMDGSSKAMRFERTYESPEKNLWDIR